MSKKSHKKSASKSTSRPGKIKHSIPTSAPANEHKIRPAKDALK